VCNQVGQRASIFLQQPNRSLGSGSSQSKQVEVVENNRANTASQDDFFTEAGLFQTPNSAVDRLEFRFMVRIIDEGHDSIRYQGNVCEVEFILRQIHGMLNSDARRNLSLTDTNADKTQDSDICQDWKQGLEGPERPETERVRSMSRDTVSDESLDLAKSWIHACIHSHKKCNLRMMTNSWYPTRLLYLQKADHGKHLVRLNHTAEEKPSGPYTTLSHRWAGLDFIKLTKQNMRAFCHGIPTSQMPKTFLDTISTTIHLGIEYLWIDSLCIMQDEEDLSNWSHEAGLMHKVYSSSYCNISASVAENCSEGLSRDRDPDILYAPSVRLRIEDHNDLMQHRHIDCEIMVYEMWKYNVLDCPLYTGGWVIHFSLGVFGVS
jgi:hypothetical protein